MLDEFFYIICRDGQIVEVKYKEETFRAVMGAMANRGIIVLKDYGTVLNGVDVSKVLRPDQYDSYLSSVNPKEYVKNGIWRDGKEKGIIRYEPWKKLELEANKQLQAPKKDEVSQENVKKLLKKYKPDFLKQVKP